MQVWDVEHRLYDVAMCCLLCELCRLASCRQDTSYSQYKDHVGDQVKIMVPKRPGMICDSFYLYFWQFLFRPSGGFGGFVLAVPVVSVVLAVSFRCFGF